MPPAPAGPLVIHLLYETHGCSCHRDHLSRTKDNARELLGDHSQGQGQPSGLHSKGRRINGNDKKDTKRLPPGYLSHRERPTHSALPERVPAFIYPFGGLRRLPALPPSIPPHQQGHARTLSVLRRPHPFPRRRSETRNAGEDRSAVAKID